MCKMQNCFIISWGTRDLVVLLMQWSKIIIKWYPIWTNRFNLLLYHLHSNPILAINLNELKITIFQSSHNRKFISLIKFNTKQHTNHYLRNTITEMIFKIPFPTYVKAWKKSLKTTYVSWKVSEWVEHVKSVKINNTSSHCVVAQIHFCSSVYDEPRPLLSVPTLCLIVKTVLNRWCISKLLLLVIPARHFEVSCFCT